MPRPLDGAAGERMELPDYYTDFLENFAHTRESWKLERGQVYAEPGEESWEAFDSGDWGESMRRVEKSREDLVSLFREFADRGTITRRIRIVSLPPSPYLQWELHVLRLRDELGEPMRVLLDSDIVSLENQGPLPDIYTLDTDVMYQAVYDDHGVLDHALRYTDSALVERCRDFIIGLYERGEPMRDFFRREIAPLPPPRWGNQAIPHDYLEHAGRPRPPRS
jgi:hypothetical protein